MRERRTSEPSDPREGITLSLNLVRATWKSEDSGFKTVNTKVLRLVSKLSKSPLLFYGLGGPRVPRGKFALTVFVCLFAP